MKNSKSNTPPLELLWIEGMGWWKDASWSPNGKVLAAAGENSISFLFYLDTVSPHVRRAIYYGFSYYLGDLNYYGAIAFAWSPDSKRIALVAEKYELAEFFVKLFVLELDIDKLIELIKKGGKEDENKCRSFEFYILDEIEKKEIFKNFVSTTLSYSKRDVGDLPRFVKPSIAWWPSKNNVIIHHTSSLTLYRLEGTRIAKVWSIDRNKMAKILDLHRDSGFYFTALIPVKNLLYAVGVYYTIPSNAKNTGSTEPLVEPLILALDSKGDIVNYCDSKCLDLKPLRKPLREEEMEMPIKDVKLSPNHRHLALISDKALLVYKIGEKGDIEKEVKKVFEASYAEAVVWFDDRTLGVIDYDGYLSLYTFNAPTLKFIGELKIKPEGQVEYADYNRHNGLLAVVEKLSRYYLWHPDYALYLYRMRDVNFLMEYTGALTRALKCDKVCRRVCGAAQLFSIARNAILNVLSMKSICRSLRAEEIHGIKYFIDDFVVEPIIAYLEKKKGQSIIQHALFNDIDKLREWARNAISELGEWARDSLYAYILASLCPIQYVDPETLPYCGARDMDPVTCLDRGLEWWVHDIFRERWCGVEDFRVLLSRIEKFIEQVGKIVGCLRRSSG